MKKKETPLIEPLSSKEAADFLNVPTRRLEDWRTRGVGPAYIRADGTRTRYLKSDLIAYVQANRIVPTENQN